MKTNRQMLFKEIIDTYCDKFDRWWYEIVTTLLRKVYMGWIFRALPRILANDDGEYSGRGVKLSAYYMPCWGEACTPTPPDIFMMGCLIKGRNFTFDLHG
jgi:hypothetical protein